MAFSVTDTRTIFTANDTVGGWDEGTTSYYLGVDFGGREGTGFVGFDIDIETIHNWEVDITIPADLSGNHYGGWIRVTNGGNLDTKINGGIRLCSRDSSGNESYFYVGGVDTYAGGWAYFVCDLDRTPDANNGTNAVVTDLVDLGVGGKLLAKSADDNFQMDLMHYGTSGITVTGTPDTGTYGTGNSLEEIYDIVDSSNYGVIAKQAGSFVFKAPVIIDTVTFDDRDSIIFFEDLPVASDFYKISLGTTTSNTISFTGFINKTEGGTACELDFSAAVTSFTYDSSTALTQGTTTFKSGDYSGDKFVKCSAIQANTGANLDLFTVDETGQVTLTGTATLTNSTIKNSTSDKSVTCENLAKTSGNDFTSDGSNVAVQVTGTLNTTTMAWDNALTSYVVGTSGTDVGVTLTGNESVQVSVNSGEILTINVAEGATVPSVANDGAGTVNVVAGQRTFKFTTNPSITGYEYRMYEVTAKGSLAGQVEVAGQEVATTDNQTYSYPYTSDTPFAVQIISDVYEEEISYYDLKDSNQDVIINLTVDTND